VVWLTECWTLEQTKSERQIEKISSDDSVVKVIDHLYKVSALALVDAEGRLVGDLSADSLRTLSVHNFKRLYSPARHMGDTVRPPPLVTIVQSGGGC
jgi:CBS domain-containing protein